MNIQSTNKLLPVFALGAILVSCGTASSASVNSNNSSKTPSSNSEFSSGLDQKIQDDIDNVSYFQSNLEGLTDHPKAAKGTINASYYYLTDSDPLEIASVDSFEAKRYTTPTTGLMERKGTLTIGSDETGYTSQVYHDDSLFYQLTDYDDDTNDVKKTLSYDPAYEEDNLSISFVHSDLSNLEFMKTPMASVGYGYSFDFPDSVPSTGKFSYGYSLVQYAEGKVPREKIIHEVTLSIAQGVVISGTSKLTDEKYAGGVKANWSISTSVATFTQGDYPSFSGTILDPGNF